MTAHVAKVASIVEATEWSLASLYVIYLIFRLYLINSPVVRADNLRFKEEGVRDVVKDVFLPWFNAYRFLMQNVDRLQRVRVTKI